MAKVRKLALHPLTYQHVKNENAAIFLQFCSLCDFTWHIFESFSFLLEYKIKFKKLTLVLDFVK